MLLQQIDMILIDYRFDRVMIDDYHIFITEVKSLIFLLLFSTFSTSSFFFFFPSFLALFFSRFFPPGSCFGTLATGGSFYFVTFDIKDGMYPVWEAEKRVEEIKLNHCIGEIKNILSSPSSINSFRFQFRICMRINFN